MSTEPIASGQSAPGGTTPSQAQPVATAPLAANEPTSPPDDAVTSKSEPVEKTITATEKKASVSKPVRLDASIDILEFARSNGLAENVDAKTLIDKAGDAHHVLAGPWKLLIPRIICADGLLEGSPGVPVTDDSEIWLCAQIPFRIYIPKGPLGESSVNMIRGARKIVAARHEIRSQPYYPVNETTLRPCSRQVYQALLLSKKTDNLFYSESERTQILIVGEFNSSLRTLLKAKKELKGYSVTIYFRELKYCKGRDCQPSWGLYRSGALRDSDWDADKLMTWNATGALAGVMPDYYHTEPKINPMNTSATLFAIRLRDPEGNVVASADWD